MARNAMVLIFAAVFLGAAWTLPADSQEQIGPVAVGADLSLDARALEPAEVWLAGLSAVPDDAGGAVYVALAREVSNWFGLPTWSLRLSAPAGYLPGAYVDGSQSGREYITLVRNIQAPTPGQSLHAHLVYNPATRRVSVFVAETRADALGPDREMIRVSVPLESPAPLLPLDAGRVRAERPYVRAVAADVADVAWGGDYIPFELQRDFAWELVDAEGSRVFGYVFLVGDTFGVRVQWPQRELPGSLHVEVEHDGKAELLESAEWSAQSRTYLVSSDRLSLGDSTLRLTYDDGSAEHVIAEQPLRIQRGELFAGMRLAGRSPDHGVSLLLELSSEQAWRNEPIRLEALFHPHDGGEALGFASERAFSLEAPGKAELTAHIPVPPVAGRLEVRLEAGTGVAVRGGGTFHLGELPPVWILPRHTAMRAAIGEPALIPLGEPLPDFVVASREDIALSGDVLYEGRVVGNVPERLVPAGEVHVVRLPVDEGEGAYEARFAIERADGSRSYLSLYFTVFDPRTPRPDNASRIVYEGPDGRLRYVTDYLGNRIPDFSHAGYMGGGVALPDVPVRAVVEPSQGDGDDRARIQAAIDAVSKLPPDERGFRGAVLLKQGTYYVEGTLNISASGVVLRGEGDGEDGTIIVATARRQHTLIQVRGGGSLVEEPGTRQRIVDMYVPVGAQTFRVEDASRFDVGDEIVVYRPGTAEWIRDLGMDNPILPVPWSPSGYDFHFERTITAINGNEITIDVPIVQAMQAEYGGGYVYKGSFRGRIQQVGVEDLRLVSEYDAALGVNDEEHAWNAITLNYVADAWVRRVTGLHFGFSVVNVQREAKRVTVEDVTSLDPISQITGSRRYSFNVAGQQVLMQRLYARNGRHDFALDSRVRGPNVFLFAEAEMAHSVSEPHHRWTVGALYDNVSVTGQTVGMQVVNRGTSGTGHGWAGAAVVFWNGRSQLIAVAKPPTAQNYAIGVYPLEPLPANQLQAALGWIISQGQPFNPLTTLAFSYRGVPLVGDGHLESPEGPVTPKSLYLKQLEDRLGARAVQNIGW